MEIRIMNHKITVDILNRSLIYTIYTSVGIMENKNANIWYMIRYSSNKSYKNVMDRKMMYFDIYEKSLIHNIYINTVTISKDWKKCMRK